MGEEGGQVKCVTNVTGDTSAVAVSRPHLQDRWSDSRSLSRRRSYTTIKAFSFYASMHEFLCSTDKDEKEHDPLNNVLLPLCFYYDEIWTDESGQASHWCKEINVLESSMITGVEQSN